MYLWLQLHVDETIPFREEELRLAGLIFIEGLALQVWTRSLLRSTISSSILSLVQIFIEIVYWAPEVRNRSWPLEMAMAAPPRWFFSCSVHQTLSLFGPCAAIIH